MKISAVIIFKLLLFDEFAGCIFQCLFNISIPCRNKSKSLNFKFQALTVISFPYNSQLFQSVDIQVQNISFLDEDFFLYFKKLFPEFIIQ